MTITTYCPPDTPDTVYESGTEEVTSEENGTGEVTSEENGTEEEVSSESVEENGTEEVTPINTSISLLWNVIMTVLLMLV